LSRPNDRIQGRRILTHDSSISTCSSEDQSTVILGYTSWVAGLIILVKIASFVEKQFLAYFFGTGTDIDAYMIAFSVPMMVFFLVTAVVNPTILPMFVRRSEREDRAGAWSQVNAWGLALLALASCGALVGLPCAEYVTRMLAPGFDPETHSLCTRLLKVMLPAAAVMGLIPLTTSVLNAQRKFVIPPLAELMMKVVGVLFIVVLARSIGVKSAAVGMVAAAVAAFLLHILRLYRSWLAHLVAPRYADPDFRHVLFLMCAPALGKLFSQFGTIVENAACSTLAPGSVAALGYARRIVGLPLLIIPSAAGTVLFTFFAELTHRNEHESVARLLAAAVRTMLFIFLPLATFTCILAEPIVAVVYQRGAFDPSSTALVARTLFWLAPSMILFAVEMMLMRHFFSREDIWTPIFIGIACVIVRVIMIRFSVSALGIVAVASAIVLSRVLKVGLLTYFASRRGGVSPQQLEVMEIVKLLPATVVSGATTVLVLNLLQATLNTSLLMRLCLLAICGGIGAAVYLAMAFISGSRECRFVFEKLTRRAK